MRRWLYFWLGHITGRLLIKGVCLHSNYLFGHVYAIAEIA
jgi:hypothetical protein